MLTLEDESGLRGHGEAAPWPGISHAKEELECLLALIRIGPKALPRELDITSIESFRSSLPTQCPATRHAWEQAALSLRYNEEGALRCALSALFPRLRCQSQVRTHLLVRDLPQAHAAANDGFDTIKFKLGGLPPAQAVGRLEAISRVLPQLKLRVDLNGQYNQEQAASFLEQIAPLGLDLVEQPLDAAAPKLAELPQTAPIALDESISLAPQPSQTIAACKHPAIVLKPAFLGGLLPTLRLLDQAQQLRLRVIITSALDSAIGRRSALAAAAFAGDETHGLGSPLLQELKINGEGDIEECAPKQALPALSLAEVMPW